VTRVAWILCEHATRSERRRQGLEQLARILGQRGMKPEIQDLGDRLSSARPKPRPPAGSFTPSNHIDDLESSRAKSRDVAAFLHSADGTPADVTMMIIASASATLIAGAAQWLGGTGIRPAVALLFDHGDRQTLAPTSLQASLLARSLRDLVRATGQRPWMAATHEELAQALKELTGWPCPLSPVLERHDEAVAHATNFCSTTPVALISNADDVQSAFAVPEIATELLRAPSVTLAMSSQDLERSYPLRRLYETGRIDMITEDWALRTTGLGLAAAILVLPRSGYRARISARFSSFASIGIPMVVPSNTWMADRIACGDAMGLAYDHDSTASVTGAASTLMRELVSWKAAAAAVAPMWTKRASLDPLVDAILAYRAVFVPGPRGKVASG
jgi:hypothetical protein